MSQRAHGRRLHLRRGRAAPKDIRLDLNSLKPWAKSLQAAALYDDDAYQDFKLLISSATAAEAARRPIVEKRIMQALFEGADVLRRNSAFQTSVYAKVAVLAMPFPSHFWSRVTVFYDADYYQTKWFGTESLPEQDGPAARHGLSLPDGFKASGTRFQIEDEEAPNGYWEEEHWTYGEMPAGQTTKLG